MVFSELMRHLKRQGLAVSESQVRWAIRQGRVARPEMDGSLRFRFSDENVAEIVAEFIGRKNLKLKATIESPTSCHVCGQTGLKQEDRWLRCLKCGTVRLADDQQTKYGRENQS